MTPKLQMSLIPTFHVEWLTYSWMAEQNKCGLDKHLARCLGREGDIELLESPNDTSYSADVNFDGVDLNPLFVADREGLIEQLRKDGNIECWKMRPLLLAAAERKWIPFGRYIVGVSW